MPNASPKSDVSPTAPTLYTAETLVLAPDNAPVVPRPSVRRDLWHEALLTVNEQCRSALLRNCAGDDGQAATVVTAVDVRQLSELAEA